MYAGLPDGRQVLHKNEDTWYEVLGYYGMSLKTYSNISKTQKAECEYSRGNQALDDTSYNGAAFNRWNDERNVNVNRNDNDWNDNWWFAGLRNSLHFSPPTLKLWRGVLFTLNVFCELSIPAAQHSADGYQWLGHR